MGDELSPLLPLPRSTISLLWCSDGSVCLFVCCVCLFVGGKMGYELSPPLPLPRSTNSSLLLCLLVVFVCFFFCVYLWVGKWEMSSPLSSHSHVAPSACSGAVMALFVCLFVVFVYLWVEKWDMSFPLPSHSHVAPAACSGALMTLLNYANGSKQLAGDYFICFIGLFCSGRNQPQYFTTLDLVWIPFVVPLFKC